MNKRWKEVAICSANMKVHRARDMHEHIEEKESAYMHAQLN